MLRIHSGAFIFSMWFLGPSAVIGSDPIGACATGEESGCEMPPETRANSLLMTKMSVAKAYAASIAEDLASEGVQATIGARLNPSVHQRLLAPKPATFAVLQEATNNTANMAHVMFATGANKLTEQTVTLTGPDGTSTMDIKTVFSTKNCENLTASDLPHLTAAYVQQIATMFLDTPAPKPVCAVAFGVLVVNAGLKTPYTGYTQASFAQVLANIIAQVLDQDGDGVADDPTLMESMRTGPSGSWLHSKRTGINKEETWMQKLGSTVQVSEEHDFKSGFTISESLRNHFEEAYHTYQHARGKAYPTIFGFPDTPNDCMEKPKKCDWTSSIASKCSAMAQCNWFRHPECKCKKQGNGASSGDIKSGGCASPSCAGIEWDYSVETAFSNNYALSHGIPAPFWKNRTFIEAKLTSTGGTCIEFLKKLKDPQYHILQNVASFHYTGPGGSPVPAPTPPLPVPTPVPSPVPVPIPTQAPAPAPPSPSGSQVGIEACEGHGFNKRQCRKVGCCFFEEGQCWADIADRCGEGQPAPAPPSPNGAPAPPSPNEAPAPPSPNGSQAGVEACEGHGFNKRQCREVGCCSFEEGQCWANNADRCGDDEGEDEGEEGEEEEGGD